MSAEARAERGRAPELEEGCRGRRRREDEHRSRSQRREGAGARGGQSRAMVEGGRRGDDLEPEECMFDGGESDRGSDGRVSALAIRRNLRVLGEREST
jgi:hypothetical protein